MLHVTHLNNVKIRTLQKKLKNSRREPVKIELHASRANTPDLPDLILSLKCKK
jgi:hypothetical protein